MFLASSQAVSYRCPGERYEITRSLHLARLAAGYDQCQGCIHRLDAGQARPREPGGESAAGADFADLVPETQIHLAPDRFATTPGHRVSPQLFRRDGVRGVYLNELDRSRAGAIAGAFASVLLASRSETGVLPDSPAPSLPFAEDLADSREGVTILRTGQPGPPVVLAHDERPASADLATGVCIALRRMGCQVIDLGFATRPSFWFAVHHLEAAGGVHVTGSGAAPAWTGLDFIGSGACPWSRGSDLDRVEHVWQAGYARPSRHQGGLRSFRTEATYLKSLHHFVHALRPLQIAWSCPQPAVTQWASTLLTGSACRLFPVATPVRERSTSAVQEADLARLREAIAANSAHFGLLIGDDAQHCTLVDERGNLIPDTQVASLLAHSATEGQTSRPVEQTSLSALPVSRRASTATDYAGPPTLQSAWQHLTEHQLAFTHGPAGFYWFATPQPACDALLTLMHLLQSFSRSDAPVSECCALQGHRP